MEDNATLTLTVPAYVKMVLHASRYVHSAVNGVLLATAPRTATREAGILCIDAVPLFHTALPLAPMLEAALALIDSWCKEKDLCIAGYYQANESRKDSSPDSVACKIAERILENIQPATLVMVQNQRLSMFRQEPAIKVYENQGARWQPKDLNHVILEREALPITLALLGSGAHLQVIDFDTHLSDIRQDWHNWHINSLIDRSC
uniref:ER membrane protein complex subunit 8 n=1 Tax=Myxine glutinosa TaxID=7769 RepID=UPI00358E5311